MPDSMASGFLQNMLQLMQLRQQAQQFQQQQALAEKVQQANMLQILASVTQGMPNRDAARTFLSEQGQVSGLNIPALLALAGGQAPSETALRAGAAAEGLGAMNPEERGMMNRGAASAVLTERDYSTNVLNNFIASQLSQVTGSAGAQNLGAAAVTRALTGLTSGQFAVDQATAGIPAAELTQGARVAQGLQLSAQEQAQVASAARGQDLSFQASMAGNRLGWAQLAQQGELGHLQLQLEAARTAAAAGSRGGVQINDIPEMIKTQQTIMEMLQGTTTPAARQQLLNSLGTMNSLLNSLGVPTPQIDPVADVNQMNPSKVWSPSTWGDRRTLPMYIPPTQPAPANSLFPNDSTFSPFRR